MSEHFDDAPYNQGDISEQRIAREAERRGESRRKGPCKERRFDSVGSPRALDDFDKQTSSAISNWQTSDPRFWE